MNITSALTVPLLLRDLFTAIYSSVSLLLLRDLVVQYGVLVGKVEAPDERLARQLCVDGEDGQMDTRLEWEGRYAVDGE